ncbi:ArsR/SmtB family transcription factor [Paraliomyxa miuraensis]|uniref:ArsR/SmtB family transcription factor n=1 Tax=Paraliomyxa miuraensis TaxID=376150 RepID=UPI002255BB44|nr:metalloregulator ArsR/SmtB family transcription factor [Paraliomyxa miuraensis]MCX4247971.1 metalloregulator ArsR/SmtB family transcription factor [Paraliomyxa miuraensis]
MSTALDQTLDALADPVRRAVVDLLGEEPRRAGALAQALSLSPPAMSRHLRVLRRAGVVEEQAHEDDARVRIYRLRPEPLQELRSWVDEVSAFWGDQLEAFRVHAEASARTKTKATKKARRPR